MENDVQKKPETSKRKKLLPLILLLILLVAGGIFAGIKLLGGPTRKVEVEVGDFETLKEVVEATTSERKITLTNDIYMTDEITVPAGVTISITDDGTQRKLIREGMDMWLFWVPEDSTLELKGTKAEGLVLDGNSASVKAGPDGALLIGEYADFVLENVVLKDGRTNAGMGGLMRVVTCNVTASNSSFTGGTSKSGGAVYAVESNLAFTNCDLSENRSTQGHGGALYVDNASTLSLNQCTLNNNYINTGSGYGGAVIITNFSMADIVDTTFDGNYTDHDGSACGGAMYIAWGSSANFSGKTVVSNSYAKGGGESNALGGAIYINEGSSMTVGEGVVFSGNSGTHGGAIYAIDTATVNLDGAVFVDNHTTKGNGGAIYCWRDPTLNAKNTTFLKNYTKSEVNAYGGAVALATGAVKATIENCTFEGNYTDNVGFCNGGALLVGEGSTVTMSGNNVFKDNWGKSTGGKNTCGGAVYIAKATLTMSEGTTFTGNYGTHGGAVYVNVDGKFIVDGAKFDDNYTYLGHGGAVCAWNGGNVQATNCVFTDNSIKSDLAGYGGAVAIYNKDVVEYVSTATFTGCTFDGNETVRSYGDANANGGAMYIGMGAQVTVNGGSVFSNNYAKVSAEKANCYGGAIYLNTNSVLELGASTFTNNDAELGGAVMANGSAKVNVNGAKFVGNYASVDHGGAIYTIKTPTVVNSSSFAKNYAEKHGGAVMIVGVEEGENVGYGTITNCTFTGNYSKTNRGGAVASFYAKNLAISGSTFTENYTDHAHGGAVFTQNMPVEIKSSTFIKNRVQGVAAGYGGAVAIVNEEVADAKSFGVITDCMFDSNYVSRPSGDNAANGGAVYAGLGTKLTINGKTEFKNNYAQASNTAKAYYGGAIYANTDCEVNVGEGVSFTGNTGRMGGAIAVVGAAKLDVTGAAFDGNSTNYAHGGAIYAETTDTVLKNSTFTGNKIDSAAGGYGGAVATDSKKAETSKTLTIDSCVFDGNRTTRPADGTAAANGGALYIGLYTKADITGTTVFKDNIAYSGKGAHNGGAIYTNTGCEVNIGEGVSFTGNTANNGGAIGAVDAKAVTLTGVTMSANQAKASGSAVYYNDKVALTINGVTITAAEGATVTDITIPAGKTLEVAGKVALGSVTYGSETSMIKLTAAVEGTATLIPTKYEKGLQLVTADNAALLSGIGAKFAVAPNGDEPWELDDEGKLVSNAPTAVIGTVEYLTLDEALAAANGGDTITLIADTTVSADAELPADVTVVTDGKTITVADGVTFTVKDGVDLTDFTVIGTVTVAENAVLTVGGGFTATEVHLLSGAKVNVATALTAADKAFKLTSVVETVDTVLVTAPDTDALKAAVAKIDAVFVDSKVSLDENTGKIKSDIYVAHINGVGYESMKAAAAAAADGETIVVRKSHTVTEQIRVEKAITIDGAGFTLTRGADFKSAMIYVPDVAGASLTLDNIVLDGNKENVTATEGLVISRGLLTLNSGVTIQNAKASVIGAAIYTQKRNLADAKLTINGATIKDSETTGNGVININGSVAEITNATVTGNKAANGAIYSTGAVTISGGDFSKNTATTSGGAIYVGAGSLSLDDATVSENTAAKHGGALYVLKGTLTIDGATFNMNQAGANGGAIELVDPATADIENTTFTGNEALNTFDDPASATDTGTYGRGGALSIDTKATVKLTNVTAKGNKARQGGAFYTYSKDLTITGGTYGGTATADANSATDAGGVFMTGQTAAQITIDGGTYTGNWAQGRGGVAYLRPTDVLTIKDGTFENNYTKTVSSDTTKAPFGGGVVWADSDVTVFDGVFTGNKANNGGVFCIDGGTAENTNDLTIHDGTFSANASTGTTNNKNGGGVVFLGSFTKLNVNGGIFGGDTAADGNTSATDGGVFYKLHGAEGNGETVITITKTGDVPLKFSYNKSTKSGRMGGVFASPDKSLVTLNVTGAEFSNNSSAGTGGAIYLHTGVTSTFTNCTFTGNHATASGVNAHGGALFVSGVNTTITGCTFAQNSVTTDKTGTGGAIRHQDVPLTIDATTVFSSEEGSTNTVNGVRNDMTTIGTGKLTNNATGMVIN